MAPQLVDRFNRPLASKKALTEEVARPGLVGVRQAWSTETAVAGLTPDRLDGILRQANQGDLDAFLTLAEEMEERDPHYGSVLQTRKLAVMGLERKLTWAKGKEDDPRAEAILEACSAVIEEPNFEDLVFHLLDAIAKGWAAPEIVWDTAGDGWRPERYEWRDPRWFQFDRETGRTLRLKEMGHPDGLELPPYRFAVHFAGRKSGLAARAGLARLVAFSFICKLYGVKDWMAYAEIFGIPMRLGKYDASATPADVQVLKRAVFGLGSDAAAVFPKSMDIEFPNLGTGQGAEIFHQLVTFLDGQVSKAVLGQTGTTDMQKGGGFAQSKVLNEVRGDLLQADAKAIGGTATSDVLTPFVAFNFGPDAPVPKLELIVPEPEDVVALADALDKLVPLGLRVGQAEVRKKLKLSEPNAAEEVLTPPRPAPAVVDPAAKDPAPVDPAEKPALARARQRAALARASLEEARQRHGGVDDVLDELQLVELDGWERTFGDEAGRVIALVRDAASFDDILTGLDQLAGDLSVPAAARSLARAMFEAAAIGEDQVRRKDT